jgi:hypothetical protein
VGRFPSSATWSVRLGVDRLGGREPFSKLKGCEKGWVDASCLVLRGRDATSAVRGEAIEALP